MTNHTGKQPADKTSTGAKRSPDRQTPITEQVPLAGIPHVIRLQRAAGNIAVNRLIQRKLTVGAAHDPLEAEADRVAEQVVSRSSIQRNPEEDELQAKRVDISRAPEEEDELMTKREGMLGSFDAGPAFERQLSSAGGGQPLDGNTRSQMEAGIGADFSNVRVHTGAHASSLNRSISAKAFTRGADVFFDRGQYNPGSIAGQRLLAHELTHTVQQGASPGVQRSVKARITSSGHKSVQREGYWEKRKAKKKSEKEEKAQKKQQKMAGRQQAQFSFSNSDAIEEYAQEGTEAVNPNKSPLERADAYKLQANQAKAKAVNVINNFGASINMGDRDTAQARQTKGLKSFVKRGQRADASVKKYGETFLKEIDNDLTNIYGLLASVRKFALRNGPKNSGGHEIADQIKEAVAELQMKVNSLEDRLKVGDAKARMMDAGEYEKNKKPFDWSSVELSASDAAMALDQNKFKIANYHAFLQMDFARITDHLAKKSSMLAEKDWGGERVANIAIASGTARGNQAGTTGKVSPVNDGMARGMLNLSKESDPSMDKEATDKGDIEAGMDFGHLSGGIEQTAAPQGKENKYLDPSLRQGKGAGAKKVLAGIGPALGGAIGSGLEAAAHPFKKNLYEKTIKRGSKGKSEVRHFRLIQGLELMAAFRAQAQLRLGNAERYLLEADQKHQASLTNYDNIDVVKKQFEANKKLAKKDQPEGEQSMSLDAAIVSTGQVWKDVTQTAIYRSTLKQYKLDVLEESKKHEKFGERALVGTGRKARVALAGVLGGSVLNMLTGGLYRIEKTNIGGGYDVKFEGKSFIDDFKLAVADYQKLAGSAGGERIRGLGGVHGARAYGVLQIVAKAIGLLKSIATTLAMFIPPGAPVLMSIALYSAVVKAALELTLMIWAGIGSAKTNDPRSRAYLKGKIAEHGLQFGGDAANVATVGTLAGLSAGGGAWTGKETFSLFDPKGGAFGGAGKHVENWSQNIGGKEQYYGKLLRPLFDQSKQVVNIGNAIGSGIGTGVNDPNVRNMTKNTQDAENEEAGKIQKAVQDHGVKPKMARINKNLGIAFRYIGGGEKGGHGKRVQERLLKIQPELNIVKNVTEQMNGQVQGL